jgi:uncharacterized protein (TIGR02001 family)
MRPTHADIGFGVAALSDYRFRGISLSDREPAVQANVDWSHRSGLFAGALVSSVRLGRDGEVSGAALQAYAGLSGSATPAVSWSTGLAGYVFPSLPQVGSLDYAEIFGRLGTERWQAGVYVSNSYFGSGAASIYLAVSASKDLRDNLTFVSHLGWLGTGRGESGYSLYDHIHRFDASLGLALDARYFTAELSLVGTTRNDEVCRAASDPCSPTLVLVLRKQF